MKGYLNKAKSAGLAVADKFLKGIAFAMLVLASGQMALADDPPEINPPVDVSEYATSLGTSLGTVIQAAIAVGLGIFVVMAGIKLLKRMASH